MLWQVPGARTPRHCRPVRTSTNNGSFPSAMRPARTSAESLGHPPGTVGVGGTRLFPPNPRSRFCRLPDPNPWSPSRTAHDRRSPAEGMSYGVETAAQRRGRLSERRR